MTIKKELEQSDLFSVVKPIRKELLLVDAELRRQLRMISADDLMRRHPWLERPVAHFFHVKGKYLRPVLLLLSARALSPVSRGRNLIQTAAAVELMHSASLLHDDVIDEARSRRGEKSVNAAYGNRIAVLVGDLFYARFFSIATHLEAVTRSQQLELFDLFSSTTQRMCLGEILEERLQKTTEEVSFDDYFAMIEYKTGSLMAACCEAAAVLLNADDSVREALGRFGMGLGLAYQIVDDAIDQDAVYSDAASMLLKAGELGDRAIDAVRSLSSSASEGPLIRLVEFILLKAEQLLRKAIA